MAKSHFTGLYKNIKLLLPARTTIIHVADEKDRGGDMPLAESPVPLAFSTKSTKITAFLIGHKTKLNSLLAPLKPHT